MDRHVRIDVVAALVVVGAFWALPALGAGGPRVAAGLGLGAVAGAAMLLRRRAPVAAVAVAAVVTAAGGVLGAGQDPMLATAWCLYPVAAERADRARGLLIGVVCGLAALGAPVAAPGAGPRVLAAGIVLAAAWLLGTAAGRQARAAEALERARVQAAVAREVHDVVGHALAVIAAEAGVTLALPGTARKSCGRAWPTSRCRPGARCRRYKPWFEIFGTCRRTPRTPGPGSWPCSPRPGPPGSPCTRGSTATCPNRAGRWCSGWCRSP